MELYVLRHGEAGKRLQSGGRDSERALTVTGEEEVKQVAKAIAELGISLDLIATSPLKRAYQTASIVAKELKIKKRCMEKWDELKPEGKKLEMYHKLSNSNQESSIMVVGHEPYLSTMISEIVFGDNDMNNNNNNSIILKKAGLAKIDLKSFEPKISGELVWLLTPKHLKKIASAK